MIYCNTNSPNMWDTWLYFHDGVHYLYYLYTDPNREMHTGEQWNGVGMARSTDGVNFSEIGSVIEKEPDAAWLGTGSVWQAGEKFMMNFSEMRDGIQAIFFAESDDLIHWTRLDDEFRSDPDPQWYDDTKEGRWDCIWVQRKLDESGWWGYLTANPWHRDQRPDGLAYYSIGMVESEDGRHWRAVAPPVIDWGSVEAKRNEVGAIEKIGDKYFLILGMGGMSDNAVSMYTFVSNRPDGPFRADEGAFRLLGQKGRTMTYFARFCPTPQGMLVNHHSIAYTGRVYLAPLKRAVIDEGGHLRLRYWEANEALKGPALEIAQPSGAGVELLEPVFDLEQGVVLEGTIHGSDQEPVGLFIEHEGGEGTGILTCVNGPTKMGALRKTGEFEREDTVDIGLVAGRELTFRLLLRHSLLEFYLDDRLVQCYSLPEPPSGRVGVVSGADQAAVSELKAWEMNLPVV